MNIKGSMLKRILKIFNFIMAILAMASMAAGAADRVSEKKRNSEHRPYGMYEKYFKRPLDFFFSSFALIVLLPVLIATALLVRLKLGSPVLFTQERPGRDGEIFTIRKFRSMTSERDENGELLPDEMRLTKFGKLLRAASIDELPELWNILKGDMSVVGPRPLLVQYLPLYNEEQKHRHDVRPGLTGLAQASGRNSISWEEKFKDDAAYVRKITFLGDMKIILETVKKVIHRDGISQEGRATMEFFKGNKAG